MADNPPSSIIGPNTSFLFTLLQVLAIEFSTELCTRIPDISASAMLFCLLLLELEDKVIIFLIVLVFVPDGTTNWSVELRELTVVLAVFVFIDPACTALCCHSQPVYLCQ